MNTRSPITGDDSETNVLDIAFNQDQGCFAIAHEHGFLVFNTDPLDLRVKRKFAGTSSGVGHIAMLHRTNYLALVGGGINPRYPETKLMIWDDLKRKNSLQLDFSTPVLKVLLSRTRIVVVLKNHVHVYGFSSQPHKIASYETSDNQHGLADLSVNVSYNDIDSSASTSGESSNSNDSKHEGKQQTLAFPARTAGQIHLVDVSTQGQERNVVNIIKAHKSSIRCLTLNRSGTLIASASETGTIIRIHSTRSTALLFEFRRGLDRADITSMRFSHDDSKLGVLSDKTTLHVFNINPSQQEQPDDEVKAPTNRHHLFSFLPVPVPTYFRSVWSFCSVNTNLYHPRSEENDTGVIGWSSNDSIIVVWKKKQLWERYVIGQAANGWQLTRHSWRSLAIEDVDKW